MKTNYKLRESVIEKKVKAYATLNGWIVRKFKSPGQRSVPDDIFLRAGRTFFIEFKAPGKTPSLSQKLEHGELRNVGFNVYVVDNIGDGLTIINKESK